MTQTSIVQRVVLALIVAASFGLFASTAMAATVFTDTFETQNFTKWTSVDNGTNGTWKIDKTRYAGRYSALVVGPTGTTDDVLRKVLPTNLYSDVTVSYWYKASGLDSKSDGTFDRVFVEYTLDGTNWVLLNEVNPNTTFSASGWNQGVHTVPASQNFALRFRANLSDSGDRVWFDNVTVEGTPTENTRARCIDGIDNDADGSVDRADTDCLSFYPTLTVEKDGRGTVSSTPAGIACGLDCVEQFLKGTVVNLKAMVTRGVSFLGWGGACTGTGDCSLLVSTDTTVTASFADVASFTLTTLIDTPASGVVTSATPTIACADACVTTVYENETITLTATAKPGFEFVGFSGACEGLSSTCVVTITGDTEVTAHYIPVASGVCGDGVIDWNEGCDDGNQTDGDGCSVACTVESGFACQVGTNGASACYWDSICPPGTTFISPNGWYGVCR